MRRKPALYMSRPSVGKAELDKIAGVLDAGWLGEGDATMAFEDRLEELAGSRNVVAVNTGTSALHLSLHTLGVGPGDEVILPSFTFAGDPMAVLACGARPVFCDIEESTFNLDPSAVPGRLTEKTKAIMPTDYAGVPADTERLRELLGARAVSIVRDASHSFGSTVRGRMIGTWLGEDATCFSFDPIKNVTCGEGGAVLTDRDDLAEALRVAKHLGRGRGPGKLALGYRYHMSDVNAAIGLAQLERMEELLSGRRKLARRYDELLADHEDVIVPRRDYSEVVPFLYVIRVPPRERDGLVTYLMENEIWAGLRYAPNHHEPLFSNLTADLPVTDRVVQELMAIPLFVGMTDGDVERVVAAIRRYFRL